MDWEWIPWFTGPRAPFDSMIFALRDDYSGVDLLYRQDKKDGKGFKSTIYFANGEPVPPEVKHIAWMLAPRSTPKYQPVDGVKLKSVS